MARTGPGPSVGSPPTGRSAPRGAAGRAKRARAGVGRVLAGAERGVHGPQLQRGRPHALRHGPGAGGQASRRGGGARAVGGVRPRLARRLGLLERAVRRGPTVVLGAGLADRQPGGPGLDLGRAVHGLAPLAVSGATGGRPPDRVPANHRQRVGPQGEYREREQDGARGVVLFSEIQSRTLAFTSPLPGYAAGPRPRRRRRPRPPRRCCPWRRCCSWSCRRPCGGC